MTWVSIVRISFSPYKINAPIFLDGMILEASAIHTAYPEYLKQTLQQRILSNNSPFESELFEVAKGERSDIIEKGPAVILASGGMLNGGASLEYFKALAYDEKNMVIFVGYNSVNSLGRRVQNGISEMVLPAEDGKMAHLFCTEDCWIDKFPARGVSPGSSLRRRAV